MKYVSLSLKGLILASLVIVGCSKEEDFSSFVEVETIEPIEIGLSVRPTSLENQPITFTVVDEAGTDISQESIFYVDGVAIETNSFTADTEGAFEVYAEFDNNGVLSTTDTKMFSVVVPKRKISIEDYTGTWCGYCPSVTESIEEVYGQTAHVTSVAIHNNDAMTISIEEDLRDVFEVFGFPSGRINRTQNWNNPFNPEVIMDIAGTPSNTGIGISSTLEGNLLTARISVSSSEALTGKKLVVYLTEDGILADQTNYLNNDEDSQYYQMGNPIEDFVHDHVLRTSLTNPFGDDIPATNAMEEFKVTLTKEISDTYIVENLKLVVMVTQDDYTTINSQYAKVNETRWYD